ncbi:membrane fusion protein, multidrug efflux system [Sphingomonas palmae]|uniref:Membrane fusion protein, multidrug efflux system n=1 Tax=Sphingomonas palmae TaxID=1855283 RepID=A0A1H7T4Q8_9SPHN|nr:efflux RND transporter periplasmic adaptor subunit [Sphingomonas palmae]SEL79718.1 membrane fusion protein, multidrug efflux system [Sphingomonas palmae]
MNTTTNTIENARARGPLVIAVIALALVFGGVFLWRSIRSSASAVAYAPPPVEVSTATVRTETLPQAIEATGTLQAVREVTLAPEVPGRVTAIRFEAGQQVGQGAELLQLFDAPERADRAAAQARARFAQIQYQRSRELAPTGAEPRELLQQREAELAQARAAIQQLDARIAQKTVRAPFGGRIGIRRVNPGQYVNAGDPLATLTALDRLYVNFSVPQQELSRLRVGGSVAVRSDAAPGRDFTATINAVEPLVGGDTRNISVQATMPNPGAMLRPGLYVTVGVAQGARADAILVPSTAIQTSASGDSVYVVRGGKAALLPVTVGSEIGDRTIVETGLKSGDVVVTTGQLRLQPGGAVKVVNERPAAPKNAAR